MGNCNGKNVMSDTSTSQRTKPHVFKKNYRTTVTLGAGAFSTVKLAVNLDDSREVAVKIVSRTGLSEADDIALKQEVEILMSLTHPNIISCYDFYEEEKVYYVVLEYMEGGELFDRIVKKSVYSELEAREVVNTILNALKYCHDRDIVHRDLKPENLLLTRRDDDYDIKIADFGFASRKGELMSTQCGTPGYIAPEILQREPYGKTVDMWSLGVITYILLGGYPPFQDKNIRNLFSKIKRCEYKFHPEVWSNVSEEAKDFIRNLLIMPPSSRLTADTALAHPWIHLASESLSSNNLEMTLKEFKRFNGNRKFRSAVFTVMAINRMIDLANIKTPTADNSNNHVFTFNEKDRDITSESHIITPQHNVVQSQLQHKHLYLPDQLTDSQREPIPKGTPINDSMSGFTLTNDDSTYVSAIYDDKDNYRIPSNISNT
eukprot:gene18810-24580_t